MNGTKILATVVVVIIIAVAAILAWGEHRPTPASSTKFPEGIAFIDVADAYSGEAAELGTMVQHEFGVQYKVYAEGSFALAREIRLGSTPSTVFISVAKEAYYPNYLGNYSPGWAIAFASDQLVIAYSNATLSDPAARSIIDALRNGFAKNDTSMIRSAFMNLTSGHVSVGISNPLTDPAGYRAFISLEIAGYLYSSNESLFVDRLLANSGNRSATNAAELVAPLEAGQIQFLFIYKSAALSHHLGYIELPSQLSLGDPALAAFYSRFNYSSAGQVFVGQPIYLFISIPSNTNNSTLAQSIVEYLLANDSFLENYGLNPLRPALLFQWGATPKFIDYLLGNGDIKAVS